MWRKFSYRYPDAIHCQKTECRVQRSVKGKKEPRKKRKEDWGSLQERGLQVEVEVKDEKKRKITISKIRDDNIGEDSAISSKGDLVYKIGDWVREEGSKLKSRKNRKCHQ